MKFFEEINLSIIPNTVAIIQLIIIQIAGGNQQHKNHIHKSHNYVEIYNSTI